MSYKNIDNEKEFEILKS